MYECISPILVYPNQYFSGDKISRDTYLRLPSHQKIYFRPSSSKQESSLLDDVVDTAVVVAGVASMIDLFSSNSSDSSLSSDSGQSFDGFDGGSFGGGGAGSDW
jgi:uncharacterized membrane protein YgcG